METKIKSFKFKHGALAWGTGCLTCHTHHFSNNKILLKSPAGELCIACHQVQLEQNDLRVEKNFTIFSPKHPTKHFPFLKGQCAECHEPHGSNQEKLLAASYSKEIYGKFTKDRYALCFKCHDINLASLQRVAGVTNFRNGEVNLHYLHIREHKKGLGCETCHSAHSTAGQKLIRTWIPYYDLQLPLEFRYTPTGGSCVTACHKLKSYDRVKEAKNEKGR